MITRAPFLKTPFSGYYHRDIPEEDVELTHVGQGTPCGEYVRRFCEPVARDLWRADEKNRYR